MFFEEKKRFKLNIFIQTHFICLSIMVKDMIFVLNTNLIFEILGELVI